MTISMVLFVISLTFIVLLIALKYWESHNRRVLFADFRARVDRYTQRACTDLASNAQRKIRTSFHSSLHVVLHGMHVIIVRSREALERRLVRMLNFIRGRRSRKQAGSASFFLRRIAHHKQQMQQGSMDN